MAISTGLFLSAIIFLSRKGNTNANKYLSLLIFIFSILKIWEFLTQSRLIVYLPHLIMVLNPLLFALGPLVLLYVYALTSTDWKFSRFHLLHFIPVLASYCIFIPVYLLTENEKIRIINSAFTNRTFIISPVFFSAAILQILVYLVFAIIKLHEHFRNIKNNFSYTERISLVWLRNLLVIFIVLWIAFVMRIFYRSKLVWGLSALFSILSVYFVGYFGYNQPVIFQEAMDDTAPDANSKSKKKYASSALTEKEILENLNKVQMLMDKERLFLKNDLKIGDVGQKIHLPAYYVSQVINERLGKNFFDFINEYRVKEVQVRLSDRNNDHLTILAIGYDSGFNSKTAFYSAFKRVTGVTPMDFKKQLASH